MRCHKNSLVCNVMIKFRLIIYDVINCNVIWTKLTFIGRLFGSNFIFSAKGEKIVYFYIDLVYIEGRW